MKGRRLFPYRLIFYFCPVLLVASLTLFLASSLCLQKPNTFLSTAHIYALEQEVHRLKAEISALTSTADKPSTTVGGNLHIDRSTNGLEECKIPSLLGFKECQEKIKWMKEMWKSDRCYSDWGVDGSDCSIYKYLSEVERWCPPLQTSENTSMAGSEHTAAVRSDLTGLYNTLGTDFHYLWMKMRINRMENYWIKAGDALASKFETTWTKKKILLHMGLLADGNLGIMAFKGGPLGELVQWADLMASLYIIGHDVSVSTTNMELHGLFHEYLAETKGNCPSTQTPFDVIYLDIYGMQALKQIAGDKFSLLQCRLRVVDSFGTEPEFNNPIYAKRNGFVTPWGMWNLFPKQFNNMFPHTPDNTFLGFVIEQQVDPTTQNFTKENIALVYGKNDPYWQDKGDYIGAIHDSSLEIHATVSEKQPQNLPQYVINHGILPGDQLQALLRKTKVFVGLGRPCEGPASMEAIANGAVFLNPKFVKGTPQAEEMFADYKEKPTSRRPTSQHPYAEIYIGPPHVRTLDMADTESVKQIVSEIVKSPDVKPYLPYEYTWLGMVERVAHQIEMQNFCETNPVRWPPLSAMQVVKSSPSQTCGQACTLRGLVCEPTYFVEINNKESFEKLSVECEHISVPKGDEENSAYPAYRDGECLLQNNNQLFSCAGRHDNTERLCACRDYIKGQVAMCEGCLLS